MVQMCHTAKLITGVKPYFRSITAGKHTFSTSLSLLCFVEALFHVGRDNLILDFFILSCLGNFSMLLSHLGVFITLLLILFYLSILAQFLEFKYSVIISAFIKNILCTRKPSIEIQKRCSEVFVKICWQDSCSLRDITARACMVHWELEEARNWRCSLVTVCCCAFTVV